MKIRNPRIPALFATAMLGVFDVMTGFAQTPPPPPMDREQVLKEIQELKERLARLEAIVANAPASNPAPAAAAIPPAVPAPPHPANAAPAPRVPFAFGDFTWMNGQSRQESQPLTSPLGTLSLYLDTYYGYSFNHPKDDTIVGSATVGRDAEFTLNLANVRFDTQYKNFIGAIAIQAGDELSLVQNADLSVNRGRNLSTGDMRYLGEAYAGYHFDRGYGINVEAGLFYSYIGLDSYLTAENWNYNRSLAGDFTPYYLEGVRVQWYPTEKLLISPWIMNGFQSYAKWNSNSAIGLASTYRPREWLGLNASFYYGTDTRNNPNRKRFHSDQSIVARYLNRPGAAGVSKMAFSLDNHSGFETGGINPFPGRAAYFLGGALANRIWFHRDRYAFTVRGEAVTNPSRYLAIPPTVSGFPSGPDNYSLQIWGITGTFDYLPTDFFNFRAEFLSRHSNVPYFAGPGGTTSPDGYLGTPGLFVPDLAKHENRLTLAIDFRL